MADPHLRYETLPAPDGAALPRVARLTLNRPDARNAYSDAMVAQLVEALDRAEDDDSVGGAILTGAGPAFSAGGDLKAMRDHSGMFAGDPAELRGRYIRGIQRIPRRIAAFPKPLVAAINGAAIGAGLDLACMCDLRVASKGAKLGSTFVAVGLVPGDGGAYFLARVVGFSRAVELILSARVLTSEEALPLGLVHEVVEADELETASLAALGRMVAHPPQALRLAKQALYRSYDQDLEQALELAATFQGIAQNSPDHQEAVEALLERRPAIFRRP